MENSIEIQRTYFADDIIQIENKLHHRILSDENIYQDILNNTYSFYTLRYNKNLAGYIVFSNCIDHTDLISVAITPVFRNLGLATNLMKHMGNICLESNLFPILLEVRKSNTPAIKLYEKLGYNKISTRENYYSNPTEDAYIYIKETPDT